MKVVAGIDVGKRELAVWAESGAAKSFENQA